MENGYKKEWNVYKQSFNFNTSSFKPPHTSALNGHTNIKNVTILPKQQNEIDVGSVAFIVVVVVIFVFILISAFIVISFQCKTLPPRTKSGENKININQQEQETTT